MLHNIGIINGSKHIGILHIMDPWHMLVTDAFNPVGAKAVFQQGWALQRFAGDNLADGKTCFR